MPRQIFLFDRPRRFVAGTVGAPGERTFYLQAADGSRVVSVALEKQQVAVLADRLEQPIDEEFRVSAMGLAWNGDIGLVVIEAQAPSEDAEVAEQTLLEDVDE